MFRYKIWFPNVKFRFNRLKKYRLIENTTIPKLAIQRPCRKQHDWIIEGYGQIFLLAGLEMMMIKLLASYLSNCPSPKIALPLGSSGLPGVGESLFLNAFLLHGLGASGSRLSTGVGMNTFLVAGGVSILSWSISTCSQKTS